MSIHNSFFFLTARQTERQRALNQFFDSRVEIPRIRVGEGQTIETLINEESLLLAKSLRNEQEDWIPRIPIRA